ncbi:YkgJ family cysteine cluster protein [Paraliomyxa miuraensis]|uniref:YkgJ family cysteine cluster protein n=1 Tax=Paraliomyxa miuraensis TaxID=376150 RepID=UPI002251A5CE|nr:YkgJ family cysteine cluster protein [Paraliomyxa miuraensis]MCX4243751.1 YkgJ family cysteine cluster protein [Paraliomyxa miuraensis]
MALADLLGILFGPRLRLPRDHITRPSRRANKAAKASIDAMQAALDKISALPGIADIKQTKRLPRGFSEAVQELRTAYDEYFETVRKFLPGGLEAKRPGEPGGCGACYAAVMPVMAWEAIDLYREVRPWRDFPKLAQRLAAQGEQQIKDIQALHTGKDPERMRMAGKAVQQGRVDYAKRMQACPFLDEAKQRCRVWDKRPVACRMHLPVVDEATTRPDHAGWPKAVKAHNVRMPVRQQVTIRQLEKRLALELNPFMAASLLQLAQLLEGQAMPEVGEAPQRMQQDGQVTQRANRNVKHAKKFQKGKSQKGKGPKGRKK